MFVKWLQEKSKEIGISPEEILERANINKQLYSHWKNEKLINTTNIISIVRTISKLQNKKTYRELILEALLQESNR